MEFGHFMQYKSLYSSDTIVVLQKLNVNLALSKKEAKKYIKGSFLNAAIQV